MMRRCWLVLLCAAGLAVSAGDVAAQTREDSAAVLLGAARQLRAEGEGAAADAVLRLLQRRYGGTAAAAEAVRVLASLRAAPEPERPGRVELLVFGTGYGMWLGAAVPLMLGSESPEAYGAGLLLGGPLGFLATRAYLKQRPLSEGQARAITFGGTWGSWQGFGWTQVFGGEEDCPADPIYGGDCYRTDPSAEATVAGTVAGGLAGIATGAVLARKPISSGVATTVSFGGLWGTWYGFAIGHLADLRDEDLLSASLVGGDAGLVAMALLAPKWNPSRNRARLVSLGGVVGLLAGLGVDLIAIQDSDDLAVAIPAATSAAGLLLAARATRSFDRAPANPEPDDGSGFSGALIDVRGGRARIDVPALGVRLDRGAGERTRTSLYLPVLQARF